MSLRKTFKFQDADGQFMALLFSELRDLIQDHLAALNLIISELQPELW